MSGHADGGSDPAQIMAGMRDHEDELNRMLADWAHAERRVIELTGALGREEAILRLGLRGFGTIPEIAAQVERLLWDRFEAEMTERIEHEATIAAMKVKYRVIERSLSSKQSRLKTERDLDGIPQRSNGYR